MDGNAQGYAQVRACHSDSRQCAWILGEVLMHGLGGVAKTLTFLCFLSTPLVAQDINSACNGQSSVTSPSVSAVQHVPMSGREKWDYYLKSSYGVRSIFSSIVGAGIKQAQGTVPEWGGGMEGYGKRFGSSFAQKAINRSIRISLNGLLHEDPRYFASNRSGIWSRSLYAIGQVFLVHKDAGGTRIAYSRFAGNFGAAYISRQWHPDSYHTTGDYLGSGFRSLGVDAAKNIFSEFWPDIKRLIHH